MPTEFRDLLPLLNSGGVLGILLIIIVGGARKMWVWGWLYRESQTREEYWRNKADAATAASERILQVAETTQQLIQTLLAERQPRRR